MDLKIVVFDADEYRGSACTQFKLLNIVKILGQFNKKTSKFNLQSQSPNTNLLTSLSQFLKIHDFDNHHAHHYHYTWLSTTNLLHIEVLWE